MTAFPWLRSIEGLKVTDVRTTLKVWRTAKTTVLMLKDRKNARVAEIREGFAALRTELADYGRAHGGTFLIYGSAATGNFHFESDIDILVDIGDEQLGLALDFVEGACRRLHLKAEIQPKSWCTRPFLDRISSKVLILP